VLNHIIIVFNHIINVFNHILTKFNHILTKFNHILDYVVPMTLCIAPWWTPVFRAALQAWSRNWTWTLWCPRRTSPSSTSASSTSPTSATSLATRSSGRRRKSPPHLAYLTVHVVSMEEMHVHVHVVFQCIIILGIKLLHGLYFNIILIGMQQQSCSFQVTILPFFCHF